MKIQIAICDDEKYAIALLESLLKKVEVLSEHQYQIHTFTSSSAMFEFAESNNIKFDIVYLDIELEKNVLGTDVGTRLKQLNPDMLLIYVSGYDCYYKDLVKAEPFDFLDKPITLDKLKQPTENAIKRLLHINQDCFYKFSFNGLGSQINLKDVVYFESRHRIIQIRHIKENGLRFYDKLDNVEKKIENIYPYFVRINKSYYVNKNYVTKVSATYICIDDMSIKISAKYKDNIKRKLEL